VWAFLLFLIFVHIEPMAKSRLKTSRHYRTDRPSFSPGEEEREDLPELKMLKHFENNVNKE